MYEYKQVETTVSRVCRITCNKCGRVVDFGPNDYQVDLDFTEIKHIYSYGSPKDGDKYVAHVCEPCMDAFYATFQVPPQVVSMTVWGEDPPDPIKIVESQKSDPPDV